MGIHVAGESEQFELSPDAVSVLDYGAAAGVLVHDEGATTVIIVNLLGVSGEATMSTQILMTLELAQSFADAVQQLVTAMQSPTPGKE